jgi:tetratricopeptide (TPR) repeat protein
MTTETQREGAAPSGDAGRSTSEPERQPRSAWRSRTKWALLVVLALTPGVAHWIWRAVTTAPPSVDLTHLGEPAARSIQAARQAVRASPRSEDAWGELGMVFLAHEFSSEAITCFQRAAEIDPSDPAWLYLQSLSDGPPDADRAVPLLERAAQLSGDDPTAALRLIEVLLDAQRLDSAEKEIVRLAARLPANPRLLLARGRLRVGRGDLEGARADIEKSIDGEPRFRPAHQLLAQVIFRLGDAALAREVEARARTVPEEFAWPDPWFAAVVLRKVGPATVATRAHALETMAQTQEQERVLREGVRDFPDCAELWAALGRKLVLEQRGAEAEEVLSRSVEIDGGSAIALYYLGVARELRGRHEAAAESFRRAVEIQPSHAAAHFDLAQVLVRLGDRQGAIESLRNAVRYKPDHVRSRQNLAALLAGAGEHADALPHLEEALRLAPSDAALRKQLDEVKQRLVGKGAGAAGGTTPR